MTKYLKTSEIARKYSVRSQTIHRLIEIGAVKGVKIGSVWRVDADDWERYIAAQTPHRKAE